MPTVTGDATIGRFYVLGAVCVTCTRLAPSAAAPQSGVSKPTAAATSR